MLAPILAVVFFGSAIYLYLYPEKDVYEYWKHVEQGNVPVGGDDDDYDDDEDDDVDEWDDEWFHFSFVKVSKEEDRMWWLIAASNWR